MTSYHEEINALSHEIWAAAQLAPGEGIADGAARIEAILRREIHSAITHCDRQSLVSSAERLEKALKDIRSLSSINSASAMNPNSFALTVLLADIHHIADTALANNND